MRLYRTLGLAFILIALAFAERADAEPNGGSYLALIGIAKSRDEGGRTCSISIPDLLKLYGKDVMFIVGFDGNIKAYKDAAEHPVLADVLPIVKNTDSVVVGMRKADRAQASVTINTVKPGEMTTVLFSIQASDGKDVCTSTWEFPATRTKEKK